MTTVSIKEARSMISVLIDKARHGEEVLITCRGKKVARIIGISRPRPQLPPLDAFRRSIKAAGSSLSKSLLKNREAERY